MQSQQSFSSASSFLSFTNYPTLRKCSPEPWTSLLKIVETLESNAIGYFTTSTATSKDNWLQPGKWEWLKTTESQKERKKKKKRMSKEKVRRYQTLRTLVVTLLLLQQCNFKGEITKQVREYEQIKGFLEIQFKKLKDSGLYPKNKSFIYFYFRE